MTIVSEAGDFFVSKNNNMNNAESMENKKQVLAYFRDMVCLIAGVLLIFSLCLRVVVVSGPSMKNTLYDGDWLLVLNNTFYKEPKHGDIIVVSKDGFDNGNPIIKRVIATEGQSVDIDFTAGVVYVDNKPLDEPYTLTPTNLPEGVPFPLVVSEGSVFVMGDNRNESKDSRSYEIGLVDTREIVGKAVFLIFPGTSNGAVERNFSRMGVLS